MMNYVLEGVISVDAGVGDNCDLVTLDGGIPDSASDLDRMMGKIPGGNVNGLLVCFCIS